MSTTSPPKHKGVLLIGPLEWCDNFASTTPTLYLEKYQEIPSQIENAIIRIYDPSIKSIYFHNFSKQIFNLDDCEENTYQNLIFNFKNFLTHLNNLTIIVGTHRQLKWELEPMMSPNFIHCKTHALSTTNQNKCIFFKMDQRQIFSLFSKLFLNNKHHMIRSSNYYNLIPADFILSLEHESFCKFLSDFFDIQGTFQTTSAANFKKKLLAISELILADRQMHQVNKQSQLLNNTHQQQNDQQFNKENNDTTGTIFTNVNNALTTPYVQSPQPLPLPFQKQMSMNIQEHILPRIEQITSLTNKINQEQQQPVPGPSSESTSSWMIGQTSISVNKNPTNAQIKSNLPKTPCCNKHPTHKITKLNNSCIKLIKSLRKIEAIKNELLKSQTIFINNISQLHSAEKEMFIYCNISNRLANDLNLSSP